MADPTKDQTDNANASRLRDLVAKYLAEAKLMQVATCKDGQPWVATVWLAHDESLNLFFISRKTRRHCEELRAQPNVAGAIVVPHSEGPGQKVRGLSFEGTAEEVSLLHLKGAYSCFRSKWPNVTRVAALDDIVGNLIATRFYKITPRMFVLYDEVNYPDDPRQELRV